MISINSLINENKKIVNLLISNYQKEKMQEKID